MPGSISVQRTTLKKAGVLVTGGPISLLTITGGRVRILDLFGVVTTVIGAVATSIRLDANPTVGADTPLCAVGVITLAPVGSLVSLTGVVADALTVVLATQGAVRGMTVPLILNPGTLDEVVAIGGTTGDLTWYITWEPVEDGAILF